MDLTDIRREYTKGGLRRDDLPSEPLVLFNQWLQQAVDANLPDPTAMTIATVNADGQPFQRIVLLKDINNEGFIFYTNLSSRKAEQLRINNKISLHFPWHMLERQVHVTGYVEQLSTLEVMKYFSSRPKESQIAAWASKQSSRLSARQALEGKFFELKRKFAAGEVPLPSFWGGYRVKFESIEFWQGGEHRLHDRFIYLRGNNNNWHVERLAP
ncbi:pyridoxamine 5'-phosphate oxidase [Photobacterium carnosum]|uniref:Pyridoxine/pyridoxamine 5'-phosphate oxidase n=1 Tax=Photobacterium carnosum TaxID=2023717 RepID=A0A2N4UMJ3_9GAMM|nr:pyridoxamine 5'-phosphate oxidase [Photobacterium carnosum]MCD9555130.1 pyridoxamine 5'-phosphate oxidase [Photobacterium carnosum]PLC56238.1 pyridoxamine 5'-phosphate oxidase [Photobacterium carnosum]